MIIRKSTVYPSAWKVVPDALQRVVTDIVWFDYSDISCHHADKRHSHHFYQLDVILEGEFNLLLDGRDDQVGRAGDAWIIPPLIWHGLDCKHPFRWCSFKFHIAPQFWPLLGNTYHRFPVSEPVRACIDALGQSVARPTAFLGEQAATAISLCLFEFLGQQSALAPADNLDEFRRTLWPLLKKIQDKPSIQWNTERMAHEMNLSCDYFARCFQRVFGQTPQRYVLEASMRQAASLLMTPEVPIKSIAEQCGYATVQSFTRAFTQVFKISPAAQRRQELRRPYY